MKPNSSIDELKRAVPIETVVRHYGGSLDANGVGRCLFHERHHHGDQDPSMYVRNNRAYCRSQQCFGEKGADQFEVVRLKDGVEHFPDQFQRVEEIGGRVASTNGNGTGMRIVATYDYKDEAGRLLYQVRRFDPKDFRQRRPDGQGGWINKLSEGTGPEKKWLVRLVLYRTETLAAADVVIVVEGEKDCNALAELPLPEGMTVTCNPMGAGKWRPEYSEQLKGKAVVMIPDQDASGRKHAHKVATELTGFADSVQILELPHGKDASEWLEGGGTAEDFCRLVGGAPAWEPAARENEAADSFHPPKTDSSDETNCPGFYPLPLEQLVDEPCEDIPWIVDGYAARGRWTYPAGAPKVGKTTLAHECIVAVASGRPWLARSTHKGKVLVLAIEEHRHDVARRFRLSEETISAGQVTIAFKPLPYTLEILHRIADYVKTEEIALVVIDTLPKWLGLDDENQASEWLSKASPLLDVIHQSDAAWLSLGHTRKGGGEYGEGIRGSNALVGLVDIALTLKRTEAGGTQRYLEAVSRYTETPDKVVISKGEQSYEVLGTPEEVFIQGKTEKVRAALTGVGQSMDALATKTGLSLQDVSRCLSRLGEGVSKEGAGRKNDPFRFSIHPSSSSYTDETNPTRFIQAPLPSDETKHETVDSWWTQHE